jgi:ABC-type uncharacterized transport system permease subunit
MKLRLSDDTKTELKWQLYDLSYVLASIVIALIVGAVFIVILGSNPFEAYGIMFSKAFSSFGQVLRRATVYILTGLAVAIPIKTGMFNMGGEGQVAAGALGAAVFGSSFILPSVLHPIVCMLIVTIIGAVLAGIPVLMKVRFGSSEVVSGIMLNYIVMYLLQYLSMYTFRGSENSPQTAEVFHSARIPRAFGNQQWSYGLLIAIGLCIVFAFVMNRTRVGLEMKSAGLNPLAARYQGVKVKSMSVLAMLLGGAMAGLGGSLEVLGGRYLYLDSYFTSYGYDGIAVSYMARNNPLAVTVTALLVSILKVGAVAMDRQTNVSIHFATALQGMIITLLVTPYLVQWIVEKIARLISIRKSKKID